MSLPRPPLYFESIGRSMWPLLRPGDMVRVDPLDRPPRPGDIVVYVDESARLVAHRVIDVAPDGRLRLRGDFAFTAEVPVEPNRIVGQLTSVNRPRRGTVSTRGPLGRLLAAGLPPLERSLPALPALARRSVVAGGQVIDHLWTAAPVRRLRRLLPAAAAVDLGLAGEADRPDVLTHVRACGRNPAHFQYGPSGAAAIVATARQRGTGTIVAFAVAAPGGNPEAEAGHWIIRDIHVRHRWRGLGIGRGVTVTLLLAIQDRNDRNERLAAGSGQVRVRPGTPRATAMFGSIGFEPDVQSRGGSVELCLPLPLPPTRFAHIVAALCRTPSRS